MPKYMIDDKEVSVEDLMTHLGAIPKARLDKAIEARREVEAKLEEANEGLKASKKGAARIAELESEVGTYRSAVELSALGITDARAQKAARAIYTAEVDGMDKPPSLTDWIKGDGAKHPMIAPQLPAAGQGQGAGQGHGAGPGHVDRNRGADGSKPGSGVAVKLTGAELQKAISEAVAGKKGAEAIAAMDALQAQQAALPEPGVATP